MNILSRIKRIGSDIRTGQNLDVYIAVGISVVVALLSILGVVSQTIIFSTLLAIMALVPYSMLVNRRQNEETMAVLSNLKSTHSLAARFFYTEDDIAEMARTIRSSQRVIIWGYTLSTHIPYLKEEFEKGLDRGLQMTILLIKPSGIALEMAAFRSESRTTKNRINKDLEANLDHLEEIKK